MATPYPTISHSNLMSLSADGQTSQSTLERTNAVHVHVVGEHEHSNAVHDDTITQLGEALKWLDLA
jgi:hypothetical protein